MQQSGRSLSIWLAAVFYGRRGATCSAAGERLLAWLQNSGAVI